MPILFIVFFVGVLGVLGAAVSAFIAWGYNAALAVPFGWPHLVWWQGWVIWILAGLLFGSGRGAKGDKR